MAKNVTKSISPEQHEAARKAAQARKKNGRGSTANRFHTGPSIMDLISDDRRQKAAEAAEQRQIEAARVKAEKAALFAERQHTLALSSPFVVNDRPNGGVDGYAKELTVRLINTWAATSSEEAAQAKVGRLALAKQTLVNTLFDELSSSEGADKAAAQLRRIEGMLKVAESMAYKAIGYGFTKAKQM